MTTKRMVQLAMVVLSAAFGACAPAARPSAAVPSLEVVHVAAPTGVRDADRASIKTALERVPPGGTV
jgi:hypothetical protein